MAWMTVEQAGRRGPSRATWERRIAGGQVASYVNDFGRRMVWVEQEQASLDLLRLELRELNREVQEVLARLEGLGCDIDALRDEVVGGEPPLRLVA